MKYNLVGCSEICPSLGMMRKSFLTQFQLPFLFQRLVPSILQLAMNFSLFWHQRNEWILLLRNLVVFYEFARRRLSGEFERVRNGSASDAQKAMRPVLMGDFIRDGSRDYIQTKWVEYN